MLNTVISVAAALPAAYAFSRYRFFGDKHLLWLLTNRMAPAAVFALPFFQLYSAFGLIDTHIAVALAHCLFNVPLAVWILEGFMSGVPREIDETAYVDGTRSPASLSDLHAADRLGHRRRCLLLLHVSWVELLIARTLRRRTPSPSPQPCANGVGVRHGLGGIGGCRRADADPGAIVIWFVRNYIAKGFALGRV